MSSTASQRLKTVPKWMSSMGIRRGRLLMSLLMLLADVAGFAGAAAMLLLPTTFSKIVLVTVKDLEIPVIPLFCLGLFIQSKLYPGVGMNPAEEIKLVTRYVTAGFLSGWIVLAWLKVGWPQHPVSLLFLWALSILCVLLLRWGVRIQAARLGLWGEPVVVIGRGKTVDHTIRYFVERRRLGYVPVLAAIDLMENQSMTCPVPVIEYGRLLTSQPRRFSKDGIQTALVDVPSISDFYRSADSKALFRLFRRVVLVSDLDWLDGASMHIQDFEGIIGIAAEKGVLTSLDAFLKRTLDIGVSIVAGIVMLPLMLVVALWIKIDSPGPVFFTQERLAKNRRKAIRPGEHRRKIRLYKFRTMVADAEGALQAYLGTHAEARREWEAFQKLSEDPRITGAGRFLRRFSIDELPQLLNVLKGEMSLVGPRPIVESEAGHYRDSLDIYASTRPGMTGLWQVSGRSRTSYEERVRYDTYYVHNWSVWLDIYILLRTAWVLFTRQGAY
jgi:Undecaprenyl-phosphate galactose phosphotransferase WbaP